MTGGQLRSVYRLPSGNSFRAPARLSGCAARADSLWRRIARALATFDVSEATVSRRKYVVRVAGSTTEPDANDW
jgi:hypothetical protein